MSGSIPLIKLKWLTESESNGSKPSPVVYFSTVEKSINEKDKFLKMAKPKFSVMPKISFAPVFLREKISEYTLQSNQQL